MSSLPFPIPDSFPFDICSPTPEGTLLCVQTGDVAGNFNEPRECASGSTPPLVSVDVTYQEKTIELYGDAEILVENSIWIGVETDFNAVWVGEDKSKSCARFSLPNVDPTAAANTVVDKVYGTAEDVVRHLNMNPNSGTGQTLVAFVAVIIALIIILDGVPDPI